MILARKSWSSLVVLSPRERLGSDNVLPSKVAGLAAGTPCWAMRFRRPLLDVLAHALAAHPTLGGQLGRLMRDAERFMDEVLAGLTGAREASGGGVRGPSVTQRATSQEARV